MGRHLTGMAEAKLVYVLLSAGTQEQLDTRHLVNDFQRKGKTLFICVMVLGIKAMYVHSCVRLWVSKLPRYSLSVFCLSVCMLHLCVRALVAKQADWGSSESHFCRQEIGLGTNDWLTHIRWKPKRSGGTAYRASDWVNESCRLK